MSRASRGDRRHGLFRRRPFACSCRRSFRGLSNDEPNDRWRPRLWPDRQAGHDAPISEGLISDVTITDPGHALFGRSFPLVSLRAERGRDYLVFGLPDGRRRTVRKSSTNLGVIAGEALTGEGVRLPRVSVRTLVPLARHLRIRFATATTAEVIRDARSSTSDPTACVAFSRSSHDLDDGPKALVEPADLDPDPGRQANGPVAVPNAVAPSLTNEGGERC